MDPYRNEFRIVRIPKNSISVFCEIQDHSRETQMKNRQGVNHKDNKRTVGLKGIKALLVATSNRRRRQRTMMTLDTIKNIAIGGKIKNMRDISRENVF
jgi:hypothetical protein